MSTNANTARRRPGDVDKPRTQGEYILLVLFALSVITLALVLAIIFTQSRLGAIQRENEPALLSLIEELTIKPETEPDENAAEAMNFWPSDLFPSVPQFAASRYQTVEDGMRAVITIPPEDVLNLQNYIDELAAAGAQVLVRADNLVVLIQAGTEIQIVPTGAKPTITLCGEPQISWSNENHPNAILPETGKLVSVKDGVTPGSLVFTYRNASISDAMRYMNRLNEAGWQSAGKLNYSNNTVLASYSKGSEKITIDYYAGSDNYQIKYEIEQAAEEDGQEAKNQTLPLHHQPQPPQA